MTEFSPFTTRMLAAELCEAASRRDALVSLTTLNTDVREAASTVQLSATAVFKRNSATTFASL